MQSMLYFSAICVLGSMTRLVDASSLIGAVVLNHDSMAVTGTPIVVPIAVEWVLLMILIGVFGFMLQVANSVERCLCDLN